MTPIEKAASLLRRTVPGNPNQKAAVEAVWIALNQPGSVVRVTLNERQMECHDRIVLALDTENLIDWVKTQDTTLELKNGSAIEFTNA